MAALDQRAQNDRGAADLVHIPGRETAARSQIGDQRRPRKDMRDIVASRAIAGMCKAAFVEPPVAATTAQAFSIAFHVTMSRGNGPPRSIACMTMTPACRA